MNHLPHLPRRGVFALAGAAATAMLPLQHAIAQTASAKGDWFAMIKAQHALVAATLDKIVDSEKQTFLQRERLQDALSYQLTAHSVAEENVLYPMIATRGMVAEADKLYIDQAHAKVMNSQLEMTLKHKKGDPSWMESARALRTAVLTHAKEDEEGNLYPRLQSMLSPQENAELTMLFAREFASVKPRRALPV